MKIARIKEIKNIGTFADFSNGASLGFEKLTFIYGLNTYGKTTLTDIFQSIKNNSSDLISVRKTIPTQVSIPQKVEISIKEGNAERILKFQNNNWENNNVSKYLEVFGSEFIHKNLFTGLKSERENKENFTQFILGEDGVQKAKEIADKKRELGEKKRNIKNLVPNFVKDKSNEEVISFLSMSIDGLVKEELEEEFSIKQQEKKLEDERLKEPQKILNLPDIPIISFQTSEINLYIDQINLALKSGYSQIKDEVLKKVNEHISNTFQNGDNAINWIKEGIKNSENIKEGSCVFCGQSLSSAQELINAYDLYFDEEYNKYIDDLEKSIDDNILLLEKQKYSYKGKTQEILTKVLQYKEIYKDENFKKQIIELESKISSLNEENISIKLDEVIVKLKKEIDIKLKKPYVSVSEINFENLKKEKDLYENLLNEIKDITETLKEQIINFKKQYEDTKIIEDKIISYNVTIKDLNKKIARINQNQECINYLTSVSVISTLEIAISTLETELAQNQTLYLTTYFSKINELFNKFGSRNFTLEMITNSRGHSPIYFLDVKFHQKKIGDDELKSVFSESDRRALALAVFWAKIDLKTPDDKSKTIVILDDPITSFDDNRIINSINLFKESLNLLSQIIVLTHYSNFIKSFCERVKTQQLSIKFFKITKNAQTSFLENQNENEFIDSEYEKIFSKIYAFINREHNNCIKSDLRPFLESLYLPTVFAKEIHEADKAGKDISSLGKIIDEIFIDDSVKQKFHIYRQNLNPEHHTYTLNSGEEDIRNFAQEMMDYLYSYKF